MDALESLERKRLNPFQVGRPYPWEKPVLLLIPGLFFIANDFSWVLFVPVVLIAVLLATLGFRIRRSHVLVWPWADTPRELRRPRGSPAFSQVGLITTGLLIFPTIGQFTGVPLMSTAVGILFSVATILFWIGGGRN